MLAVCLFALASCRDERLQPSIEGVWHSVGAFEARYIFFGGGVCEVTQTAGGTEIARDIFSYEHNRENGSLTVTYRGGLFFDGRVRFLSSDEAHLEADGRPTVKLKRQ